MRSKHADELTDRDKAEIALLEERFGRPIKDLLQRKRNQTVSGFARQLGISVEKKRKWSRLTLGQADVIQEEPCEDCGRLFRPTNFRNEVCDECSYQRHVHECACCGTEFTIFNPFEAMWYERDGFCSEPCAIRWRTEKRQEGYTRWFTVFWIGKEPESIPSEELTGLTWEEIRQRIIARDEGKCRNVSCSGTNKLRVLHIDGDKRNLHPQNLVTLCGRCHGYVIAYGVDLSRFCEQT